MSVKPTSTRTRLRKRRGGETEHSQSPPLQTLTRRGSLQGVSIPIPPMSATKETSGRRHGCEKTTFDSLVVASSSRNDVLTCMITARPVTERSMSPGQLDDGTHVKCSGERGEAYTPPGTIDKIKGKLHFGGKS